MKRLGLFILKAIALAENRTFLPTFYTFLQVIVIYTDEKTIMDEPIGTVEMEEMCDKRITSCGMAQCNKYDDMVWIGYLITFFFFIFRTLSGFIAQKKNESILTPPVYSPIYSFTEFHPEYKFYGGILELR